MYQLTTDDTILRLTDNTFIPPDPANADFAQFALWVLEGNTPDPAPAPPVVTPPTPAEKLKAAGLTVEELKELLAS